MNTGKNHPMYKTHPSKETRRKMGEAQKGNKKGKGNTEKKHTEETKRKMRLSRIKNIRKNYGNPFPNYNKEACEYFREFDKEHNTKGRYAVYGGGEYLIEELGYWPDYINFDKKLIIEWDDPKHYRNGRLKQKDKQRQKEIQEYYSDFKFIRIKNL